MRKILVLGLVAAAVLLCLPALAGVAGTEHDLSDGGVGGQFDVSWGAVAGNARICAFCHTPHGAAAQPLPLWNRTLPAAGSFTPYGNPQGTMEATPPTSLGPGSLACLSCHDGSVALDALTNPPYSWPDNTAVTFSGDDAPSEFMVDVPTAPFVGRDLTYEHPVGMQYGLHDGDTEIRNVTVTGAGIPDEVQGTTTIVLYNNGTGNEDIVACVTCHDVHNQGTAALGTAPFLVMSNTDSAMCLVCHDK